jgi:uncharacterized protein YdaU (DUF1376 family)
LNAKQEAFYLGMLKTAESIEEPIPEEFIKEVVKLPPKERKEAVQAKLKNWFSQVKDQIKSSINNAEVNIKKERIEKMKEKKEKQKEEGGLMG